MAPTLERVDHVHVFVSDRMASEQWYAKVMGLRRVKELEFWAADGGPLTIANPSGTIHLALFERPADRCRSPLRLPRMPRSSLNGVLTSASRSHDRSTRSITKCRGRYISATQMEIHSRSRPMTTPHLRLSSQSKWVVVNVRLA